MPYFWQKKLFIGLYAQSYTRRQIFEKIKTDYYYSLSYVQMLEEKVMISAGGTVPTKGGSFIRTGINVWRRKIGPNWRTLKI